MNTNNPFQSPESDSDDSRDEQDDTLSSSKAAYNVVTDTVGGVNLRKKDNQLQALFVMSATLAFAAIGAVLTACIPRWELPVYAGALIGGIGGMVIGTFSSGIYLMIYRAIRHAKGKHD